MSSRYAVIGSGRQGTAAGYDFLKHGDAEVVIMADTRVDRAQQAANRLQNLTENGRVSVAELDASDPLAVQSFLQDNGIDAFLSAVPYFYNLDLTNSAIEAGSGMTDLGGNSDIVLAQLDLNDRAKEAGISVVPDCGQVPGMGTSLVLYAMEHLDDTEDVLMWDCGLPQEHKDPWHYRLTFNIEGLTNEYDGDCLFLRDGKLVGVPALEELEMIDFPEPIGRLEGFTTSGGLTTAAQSFEGRLRTLQNKTLRYPGNFEQLKMMQHLGLLNKEAIQVENQQVVPRQVLHALWEPQIRADDDTRDFVLTRILARGAKDGEAMEAQLDFVHYFDEETGFTAMEQATGWHAAIMTEMIASGEVPSGVIAVEDALNGSAFVAQAEKRGFKIDVELRPAG